MKNIKIILSSVAILLGTIAGAQEISPKFEKQGELIKGTFYYEDGSVKQEGTYKNGKLHGEWVSYGFDGEKTAIAQYANGIKDGKWFFWNDDLLTEVDYNKNTIAEVRKYKFAEALVQNR